MQKLLLTGGSGYIGSHTLLELARTGQFDLVVFDNFKNGHKEAVSRIAEKTNSKIEMVVGELLDKKALEQVFSDHKFDGVIHFAALIEAGVSVEHPLRFYENNVSGTINLLEAMQNADVRNIVFSSTAAVYGTPEDNFVTEESPPKPENPYGDSKLAVENILKSLASDHVSETDRINHVILRYFNAAGADPSGLIGQDYPKPTHLITVAIEAALGIREKLVVFGNDYPTPDGTNQRDYIHVSDLASAHLKAWEYLSRNGRNANTVFNIGTGKATSNLEIVNILKELHGDFPYEFGLRRPGDPASYYANNLKATQELGWEPKYGIKQAVEHGYNWKKNNPNGFSS